MACITLAIMWVAVSVPISIGIYITHSPWFLLGFLFVSSFRAETKSEKKSETENED